MFGRGRRRIRRIGGPKNCICPGCGFKKVHVRGERCSSKKCPKCGARLMGQW